MKLAVITARGGSKRIPRKNIREFCGKPIISYSIQTALESGCFDEVMVSTDDEEIAAIAKQYGAVVPFMRSAATSNDFATTVDVLLEVLEEYNKHGIQPKYLCGIYPTAPFITTDNLCQVFNILASQQDVQMAFPVVKFSYPIQRALRVTEDAKASMFYSEHLSTRSQDLEAAYHDAGQFYWIRTKSFLEKRSLLTAGSSVVVLPEWQVQDIDTPDDWVMAEMKYQMHQKNNTY